MQQQQHACRPCILKLLKLETTSSQKSSCRAHISVRQLVFWLQVYISVRQLVYGLLVVSSDHFTKFHEYINIVYICLDLYANYLNKILFKPKFHDFSMIIQVF